MKYFTISELCRSAEATLRGWSNAPDTASASHLIELVDKCLDPLREFYGKAIKVTSGYRCEKVNKAAGGSSTSAHKFGYAADLKPVDGKMAEFQKKVLEWSKTHTFDQIIIEYPNAKNVASWIHIGVRNSKGSQRKEIRYTKDGKSYPYVDKTNWDKFYNV